MKKKSLSILIAVALATTTIIPAASVFADTTTTAPVAVTAAPASTYGVEYEGQVQNIGWQAPVTTTGDAADITTAPITGTVGKSLRVEAVKIAGTNLPAGASITYQAQVQNKGWMTPVTSTGSDITAAAMAGTQNQGLRVEAFKMTLTGLPGYAVEYQTQVQNKGWMTPVQTENGTDVTAATMAGTQNQGLRMEALRIELVKTTTEKAAEVTAINAVQTAETSGLATDVTAATTAITAVQDTVENAALTARIAAINTAVSSVTATSATTMQVAFTAAPKDPSKVVFNTTNSGTAVATTVTWNATNTVATLTSAYNFPDATYAVDVVNDTKDLGSTNVTITDEAVAKITITSSTLAVNPISQKGYATYKVYDQYGVDITNTTLGNDITWTPGIGTLESAKDGTIVIDPITSGTPLSAYTSAVINGYDTDNYVTTSATLNVSQSSGVLSGITLNKLTSPNNDDFNAGDTSGQWYLDFTALDASGNPTTDYTLINAGIQSVNLGGFLTDTATNTNGIEEDPNDSTKAAIPIQINSTTAATLATDTQIPITVLTTSGKSSTLTVTLKKAAAVNTFSLSSPTSTVSSGQTVTIPFTAYDQNGVALDKYTDFVTTDSLGNKTDKVNLSLTGGTLQFVKNADGTASVQGVFPTVSQTTTEYLQSNVIATGKSSSLTVSVQKATAPDSLAVDTSTGKQFFQVGATLGLDFGYNNGGLTLNDQYGRAIDITNQDTTSYPYYKAVATSSNASVIALNAKNNDTGVVAPASTTVDAYNNNEVDLTAGAAGSASVSYEIYKVTAAGVQSDTGIGKSVEYTVLNDSDITGYTLDTVSNPIDMVVDRTNGLITNDTDKAGDYAADPTVWGTTSSGVKVRVKASDVISANVSSSDFSFGTAATAATTSTAGTTDFKVYGRTLSNSTSTGSSAVLTVEVQDGNGIEVASTPITSTTSSPVVSSIGFSASNEYGNKGISVSGNTVTVKAADYAELNGEISKFDPSTGVNTGEGAVYFYGNDQFGTKDADLSNFTVTNKSLTGLATATVTGNALSMGATAPTAGDSFVLTGISANGKIATVKILFN